MNDIKTGADFDVEYATFKVGEALFGIDIVNIHEISKDFEITPLPQSSAFIQGILNLRGKIVTVIDLGNVLNLTPAVKNKGNRNIIVDSQDEYIGLLVDTVGDVVTAGSNDLEPAPSNIGNVKGRFFKGVLKAKTELIGILDIDTVLNEC